MAVEAGYNIRYFIRPTSNTNKARTEPTNVLQLLHVLADKTGMLFQKYKSDSGNRVHSHGAVNGWYQSVRLIAIPSRRAKAKTITATTR